MFQDLGAGIAGAPKVLLYFSFFGVTFFSNHEASNLQDSAPFKVQDAP